VSVRGWLMKLRARADVRPLPAAATAAPPLRAMTGKYVLLYEYLEHRHADTVVLTFAEIEDLLGFALPDQARGHREWWTDAAASMAQAPHSDAWILAHRTAVPNLTAQSVVFDRAS
jgi:hypothetical protein